MPCRDYYDDHPEAYYGPKISDLKKQVSFAESALCMVLNNFAEVLEQLEKQNPNTGSSTNPLDLLSYSEAGITRKELAAWWQRHKELDAKHREEERKRLEAAAEKARLKALKKKVLARLTPEERKALNVK